MILGNTRQIANIVAPELIFGKQIFFFKFWLTDEDSDKKWPSHVRRAIHHCDNMKINQSQIERSSFVIFMRKTLL